MIRIYRSAGLALLTVLTIIQVASAGRKDMQTASLALKPCEIRGTKDAKCGTFEVFENRATRKGRKIPINVLVLPATGQKREPDPLFYVAGGPGSAATEDAPGIAQILAGIREHRDLVFVDQRGTGKSNPLNCDLFDPADPQSFFGAFLPLEAVRKCRQQLESKADLSLYTTDPAMDDIDEVRAALGYDRINLYGGSYGTRAALVYLRRHPKHVRAAVLHGVSPTNQFMPLNFPQDTERALQGVLSECEADEACRKAFPQVKADAKRVLEQLLQSPAEAEVQIPNSSNRVKLKLNRNVAAEAIRYMLYSPGGASRVPLVLHRAAEGNYGPLANAAFRYRMFLVATGSNGMYLSVTCAEDLPFVKASEAAKLAANTFLGDYRARDQSAACELWPRGTNDRNYAEPVRSDKPVLIVTGEWDPVTPPAHGDAVAKTLKNSLHVVIPDGAHGLDGLENIQCLNQIITQFISRGAVKDMDTSCVTSIRRRGFALQ